MRLTDFNTLTFDCYGTLIDWETGIHTALQPLLARLGAPPSRDAALEAFGEAEAAQEAETPAMIYSEVLTAVHRRLAQAWGATATEAEHRCFGASVPDWPAFPDSAQALAYLQHHYKLVILSNVDRASFAGSNRRLGVAFDAICTAQDIGSYKPDPANFEYLLRHLGTMGIGKADVLHTAQSLFHDHVPARKAGLATAWIDRRHDKSGWGATPQPSEQGRYDFRFTSLGAMADAHRQMAGGA